MSETMQQAVLNAAASSAMEGLPLNQQDFDIIQDILEGKMTLQEYLKKLQSHSLEI